MQRNTILVAAVAAMMAFGTGVRAQDTTTTTTAPMDSTSAAMPMSGDMSSGTPDFKMLNNKTFDYTDLMAAKARGLSDDQVATVAKIADKTGVPFRDVADAVIRGVTFAKMADMYNLRLQDVLDVNDEKAKIDTYKTTYEMTGWKNVGNMGNDMSEGMTDNSGMTTAMPSTSSTTSDPTGTSSTTTTTTTTTGQ